MDGTTLEKVEKDQTAFKSYLRGKWKNKSENRISAIENINNLYKSREKVIKLFNNNSKIASEAKYKSIYGEDLRILTPKQMLQKLPIALAQVKAGNNSENLLYEIREIVYSLYQSKKITK